ncbi:hypothetical protein WJX73_002062 [Symbiochloris irregularis]|uniref:Uncharacterized protein n=1 Tax=Symbiochloris irregularis TaxID=706552 RepID=A0AAW1NXE4_9CHLO
MSAVHGLSQYLPVGLRKQINPYNAQAAALWGGTGLLGALFVVQPFSWMYSLVNPPEESEEGGGEGEAPAAAQK